MLSTVKKDFALSCRVLGFIIVLGFLKNLLGIKKLLGFCRPKRKERVRNREEFSENLVQITCLLLGEDFGLRPNCLLKSLVYFHFLNKAGINARIHFGIEKGMQELRGAGHAWVTVGGECFPGYTAGAKEKFAGICSFPA